MPEHGEGPLQERLAVAAVEVYGLSHRRAEHLARAGDQPGARAGSGRRKREPVEERDRERHGVAGWWRRWGWR